MECYDVFNGDADGICALHQLRLNEPRPGAALITGVKRDISLLSRIAGVHESRITVLDISLDRNRESLTQLLAQKNEVLYIDHHFSGAIPEQGKIVTHIDSRPLTCTSLIVDTLLGGQFQTWAIAGAFGDNMDESALQLAKGLQLYEEQINVLKTMGILLNYNGYGATIADLFFHPGDLYQEVHLFDDPFEFYSRSEAMQTLRAGYNDDMTRARETQPVLENSRGRIYRLVGEAWARRVAGVFSNTLSRERPELAHGLIIPNSDGTLRISVRAPLTNRTGADSLCRLFPTGGGRPAAAGINNLPPDQEKAFLDAFLSQFAKSTKE